MLFKSKIHQRFVIILLLIFTHIPYSAAENKEQAAISLSEKALAQAAQRLTGTKQNKCANKCATLLTPLADKGDTEALLWLGRMHRDGLDGNQRNLEKAFSYFEKAGGREGNNHEAQYDLGRAYLYGEGTDRNLIAAYIWTTLSLDSVTSVEDKAKVQQQQLTDKLTKPQIQSAQLLIDKIRSLYLKE